MNPKDYTHKDIQRLENEDLLSEIDRCLERQEEFIRLFCDEFLLSLNLRGHWMKRAKSGQVLSSRLHDRYREILLRSDRAIEEAGLAFRRGRAAEGIEDLAGCIVNIGAQGVLSLISEDGDRIKLPSRKGEADELLWDPYDPPVPEDEDDEAE